MPSLEMLQVELGSVTLALMIILWLLERIFDMWLNDRLPDVNHLLRRIGVAFLALRILFSWIPGMIRGTHHLVEELNQIVLWPRMTLVNYLRLRRPYRRWPRTHNVRDLTSDVEMGFMRPLIVVQEPAPIPGVNVVLPAAPQTLLHGVNHITQGSAPHIPQRDGARRQFVASSSAATFVSDL